MQLREFVVGAVALAGEHLGHNASVSERNDNHGHDESQNEERDVHVELHLRTAVPVTVGVLLSGQRPRHHKYRNADQHRD